MDAMNLLDLTLHFADTPIILRMGHRDFDTRHTWNVGRHCNVDYEVHILLSGHYTLDLGAQSFPIQAPQAVIVAPGEFHYPHDMSKDFERFSFSFMPTSPKLTEQLFSQVPQHAFCTLSADVLELCQRVFVEIKGQAPFREDALCAMYAQILVQCFRGIHLELHAPSKDPVNTSVWRNAIIDYFFSPWPNAFGTEDELVAQLNISRRQLNRILMQNYGLGFRQKMLQSRMEYAGCLLRATDHKVGEIGISVGYTAESSFYKAFQSYYHMTPQEYRRIQLK